MIPLHKANITQITPKSFTSISRMQQNTVLHQLSLPMRLGQFMSDEMAVFQKTIVAQFTLEPSLPLARMDLYVLMQ